ncbi:hypothetical protein SDC9_85666 [bioreactor metagenome]|uniref:HTH cro/C1-type domain-containing protein n=1 Tax=bioreactor metagenome TaxID=1076179 RepID=A0A644ZDS0_9ZZZZ
MSHEEQKSCEAIGKKIRDLRREQGLTQAQLAGLANTGIRLVGDLENGKATCQTGKLLRVLSALGVVVHIYSPYNKEE